MIDIPVPPAAVSPAEEIDALDHVLPILAFRIDEVQAAFDTWLAEAAEPLAGSLLVPGRYPDHVKAFTRWQRMVAQVVLDLPEAPVREPDHAEPVVGDFAPHEANMLTEAGDAPDADRARAHRERYGLGLTRIDELRAWRDAMLARRAELAVQH